MNMTNNIKQLHELRYGYASASFLQIFTNKNKFDSFCKKETSYTQKLNTTISEKSLYCKDRKNGKIVTNLV